MHKNWQVIKPNGNGIATEGVQRDGGEEVQSWCKGKMAQEWGEK